VQRAQRSEATVGDILAAILQQPKSYAAQLLADQGVTRLDVLNYISHGISKVPVASAGAAALPRLKGQSEEAGPGTPADPLRAYCVNLAHARGRASSIR
jgi:ATP-dependent Clp protease ATP-binding subunit ClpA